MRLVKVLSLHWKLLLALLLWSGLTSVNRTTLSRSLQHKHPNVSGTSLPFSTVSVSLVDRDFQTNNQPATILQTTASARWLDAVHIPWSAVIWGVVWPWLVETSFKQGQKWKQWKVVPEIAAWGMWRKQALRTVDLNAHKCEEIK